MVVSLAAVSLFILPVHIFTYEMLVFQPLLVLFLAHYLLLALVGIFKRKGDGCDLFCIPCPFLFLPW